MKFSIIIIAVVIIIFAGAAFIYSSRPAADSVPSMDAGNRDHQVVQEETDIATEEQMIPEPPSTEELASKKNAYERRMQILVAGIEERPLKDTRDELFEIVVPSSEYKDAHLSLVFAVDSALAASEAGDLPALESAFAGIDSIVEQNPWMQAQP